MARDTQGKAVLAEVVREVASTRTLGISVGPAATAREVVRLLVQAARERGGAPLVLCVDNAGVYTGKRMQRWCAAHRVVLQRNQPRTPQHNAAVEHGMGEIKADAQLPRRGVHANELVARLLKTLNRLHGHRLRRTRGWRTAL